MNTEDALKEMREAVDTRKTVVISEAHSLYGTWNNEPKGTEFNVWEDGLCFSAPTLEEAMVKWRRFHVKYTARTVLIKGTESFIEGLAL